MTAIVQPIALIYLFNILRSSFTCHLSKSAAIITDKVLLAPKKAY